MFVFKRTSSNDLLTNQLALYPVQQKQRDDGNRDTQIGPFVKCFSKEANGDQGSQHDTARAGHRKHNEAFEILKRLQDKMCLKNV